MPRLSAGYIAATVHFIDTASAAGSVDAWVNDGAPLRLYKPTVRNTKCAGGRGLLMWWPAPAMFLDHRMRQATLHLVFKTFVALPHYAR